MEITITRKEKVEAKFLQVIAGVRYWEDASVNGVEDAEGTLIPFRKGDSWCPVIDIEAGKILDWPAGKAASIHYKVCDAGVYRLLDADQRIIAEKDGYVPDTMCPEGEGYGDYIIMNIHEDGTIDKWDPDPDDFEAVDGE